MLSSEIKSYRKAGESHDRMQNSIDEIKGVQASKVWEKPAEYGDETKEKTIGNREYAPPKFIVPAAGNDENTEDDMENFVHRFGSESGSEIVGDERNRNEYKKYADDAGIPL